MAETITEMCNMSLGLIGAQLITDYDNADNDYSPNAEKCRLYFPNTWDAVLRSHLWNCATHRAALTNTGTAPAFGYDYQCQLPSDPWCLRVWAMVNTDTDAPLDSDDYPWRVEGRMFLCNESSPSIRYIKRITNMAEADPLLIKVQVYSLAADLAPAIQQNKRLPKEVVDFLIGYWKPLAKSIDAHEGSTRRMQGSTLLQSRIL